MAVVAVVEVEAGPAKGLSLTVTGGAPVDVGRDKSMPGCLRDQTISRRHGIFTVNIEGELKYTDSSRNGTWYVKNGDKQPTATLKESSQIMQKGDALLLGHTCIRVKSISREAARSSTPTGPSVGVPASAAAAGPTLRTGIDDGKAKRVYDHPFTRLFREASAGKALFLAATADHTQHG